MNRRPIEAQAVIESLNANQAAWRRNLGQELDDELRGDSPHWWWTGKCPSECPGLRPDGKLGSLPAPDLSRATRRDVLDYFDNTWTLTEVLFAALQGEEPFYRPPYHQLRHPMIFYYAHTAVVFINKIRVAGLIQDPLDAYFERLFEVGVDEMSWDDLSKNEIVWPTIKEAHAYRIKVYQTLKNLIETHPSLDRLPIEQSNPAWAIFMGLEHERIHLETSSVLMRELPIHLVRPPRHLPGIHPSANAKDKATFPPDPGRDYPANAWVSLPAGQVTLGKPKDVMTYGWDNEFGERKVLVRPFSTTKHLVTNGEFFEFVQDGGYRSERFWTEEGWKWRQFRNIKWPAFWVPDGPAGLHRYKLRTCFDVVEMPWDWPAEVNYHEAKAYAAWKAEKEGAKTPYRLLTEAEHHRLRDPKTGQYGEPANLHLAYSSASPVEAFPPTNAGVYDVCGNVWHWVEDHFNPLSGFKPHPYYDDFSTPCFDDKHQMILGGSFMSTGEEASPWARFHFRPHFYQHAGFRLARSEDGDPTCDAVVLSQSESNVYETKQSLGEYMLLHYAAPEQVVPHGFGLEAAADFPLRCAEKVVEVAKEFGVSLKRALDLGCAVGRASFELARTCEEVVGIDLSASFIDAANTLQREGQSSYFRKDEGDLGIDRMAYVPADIDRSRVSFRQADACALPADLADFDAVLMANLVDRLPSPKSALERMGGSRGIVRPGGLLVITTPCTWLETFTPKVAWLGGYEKDGKPVTTLDGLQHVLGREFELLSEFDMPLVIREHARKYQFIVAKGSVWRRQVHLLG